MSARSLAVWWDRPVDEAVESWELPGDLRDTVDGELADEYERLFVGPGRVPCPPYESLWRSDAPRREQGRLMAACAVEVAQVYADLGLRVRADAHELPDHLVVELEALAYALEQGASDAAAALQGEHLAAWLPPFCARVEAETTHPFYRALARRTPGLVAALEA